MPRSGQGSQSRLRVLVAGGGVAAVETVLALRALAADLVDLDIVSPEPQFWYRPVAVAEPFEHGEVRRFELASIATATGAALTLAHVASIDPDAHVARTSQGAEMEYDALVVACGALPRPWLHGALTFRGPADSDAFQELLGAAESGRVSSICFASPATGMWPLPLYELALQTAAHLAARESSVRLELVTPEPEPLSLFGAAAIEAMTELLRESGIAVRTGSYPTRYDGKRLELVPRGTLHTDRVVALPRLEGVRILGLPQDADGFVATDLHGRVHGVDGVYAAGDITRFPIRQGGVATQQADAVAEAIAALAGAALTPRPFDPVLRGLLLTGGEPRYFRHRPRGGAGDTSAVSKLPLWWPPSKIAGRYLTPFLAGHELHAASAVP
jgi:sulfide:quinone oxidoreductase